MYTALVILILLVCVLLALVVLAQNPKGGGLSSQFGAGGAANLMGVKRTGDLLEKLTWGFAIALVLFSLGTHMVMSNGSGPVRSVNQEKAMQTRLPAAPPAQAPMSAPADAGAAAPAGAEAPAPAADPNAAAPAPQPATPAPATKP